jgi:hypothetical protein
VQQILSENPAANEALAARADEFAPVKPLQQQRRSELTELASAEEAMRKAATVVSFVFPVNVTTSLTENLPSPLTQGMLADNQHHTAGVG